MFSVECSQRALQEYFTGRLTETINEYKCNICTISTAYRTRIIEFWPSILIVNLKRYEKGSKIFTTINNQDIQSLEYQLLCYVKHDGDTVQSGHYRTIELRLNESVVYDDKVVTFAQTNCFDDAYILVYKRRKMN